MNPSPTRSDDFDAEEREEMAWCDECARQGFALLDQMEAEDEARRSQNPRSVGGNAARITP